MVFHLVDTYSLLRGHKSYSVPDYRFALSLESHYLPRYFVCIWVKNRVAQLFPCVLLDRANNPRRPDWDDDNSNMDSYAYSCLAVLEGISYRIYNYPLSFPLHNFDDQSLLWGMCFTHASEDRNFTCTIIKLS
jgi:hypothetical protein